MFLSYNLTKEELIKKSPDLSGLFLFYINLYSNDRVLNVPAFLWLWASKENQ
jgi:hypothetical protein